MIIIHGKETHLSVVNKGDPAQNDPCGTQCSLNASGPNCHWENGQKPSLINYCRVYLVSNFALVPRNQTLTLAMWLVKKVSLVKIMILKSEINAKITQGSSASLKCQIQLLGTSTQKQGFTSLFNWDSVALIISLPVVLFSFDGISFILHSTHGVIPLEHFTKVSRILLAEGD